MSDPNVSATGPSLLAQTVALVTRHGLTVLAGFLAERGIIATDQETQLVSIGVAIAVAAAAVGWSFIQKAGSTGAKS